MTHIVKKSIRGLRTAWIQAGSTEANEIFVFLHGFPDGPESFSEIQEAFSQFTLTIAPFVRGCDESEATKDLSRYRLHSLCLDVLEIIQKVDPTHSKKIILVAHDMGVPVAWKLRQLLATRLTAAVMINGLSIGQMMRRWKRPVQHLKSWYIYVLHIPKFSGWIFSRFPKSVRKWMLGLGKFEEVRSLTEKQDRSRLEYPRLQYKAFLKDIPAETKFLAANRKGAPVLVLWGKDDSFLLAPSLDELETEADRVEVRILEGNHWFFRDKPEVVTDLIREFVKKNTSVKLQENKLGKEPADRRTQNAEVLGGSKVPKSKSPSKKSEGSLHV